MGSSGRDALVSAIFGAVAVVASLVAIEIGLYGATHGAALGDVAVSLGLFALIVGLASLVVVARS